MFEVHDYPDRATSVIHHIYMIVHCWSRNPSHGRERVRNSLHSRFTSQSLTAYDLSIITMITTSTPLPERLQCVNIFEVKL